MRSLTQEQVGFGLVLIGVVLVATSTGFSALAAPDISVDIDSNSSVERGRTLVGVQGLPDGGTVVLLDAKGNTIWQYGGVRSYFGVTMLDNGTVLATPTIDHQWSCGPYSPPCTRTGIQIIDPKPSPHVVSQWTFPIRNHKHREVHDAEPLPSEGFLLTDMDHERIFTLAPNGTITWQWNGSSYYDAPPDPTKTDWLHINDVDRIGPGRYLISVRNANQLLIVERGKGVVEVINEDNTDADDNACRGSDHLYDYDNDGDIRCGDPTLLNEQHNPQYLSPNAILVADSENSRVVELHKENGEWNIAWSIGSAGGMKFDWPRDADRLPNGNTLITDTRNNRIVEVTENGTVVWSATTLAVPYEADRLPAGERPTGKIYNASEELNIASRTELPVFSTAHAALTHVVPIPYWFGPWNLVAIAIAICLVCAGAVLVVIGE
jgi:hypothetical protein